MIYCSCDRRCLKLRSSDIVRSEGTAACTSSSVGVVHVGGYDKYNRCGRRSSRYSILYEHNRMYVQGTGTVGAVGTVGTICTVGTVGAVGKQVQ